jgi:hypothetical protein
MQEGEHATCVASYYTLALNNPTKNALGECIDHPKFGVLFPLFHPASRSLRLISLTTGLDPVPAILEVGPEDASACLRAAWSSKKDVLALCFDSWLTIIFFDPETLRNTSQFSSRLGKEHVGSPNIAFKWTNQYFLLAAWPTSFLIVSAKSQSIIHSEAIKICDAWPSTTQEVTQIMTVLAEEGSLTIRHSSTSPAPTKILIGQFIRSIHLTGSDKLVCLHKDPDRVTSTALEVQQDSPLKALFNIRSVAQKLTPSTISGTILNPSQTTEMHTSDWPSDIPCPSSVRNVILTREDHVAFSDATSPSIFLWRPNMHQETMELCFIRLERSSYRVLGLLDSVVPNRLLALIGDYKSDPLGFSLPSKVEYSDLELVTLEIRPSATTETHTRTTATMKELLLSQFSAQAMEDLAYEHSPPSSSHQNTASASDTGLSMMLEMMKKLDAKLDILVAAQTRLEQRVDNLSEMVSSRR